MPNGLFSFLHLAQDAVSRLKVQSALNPFLWLCGVVSIPCFVLSYLCRDNQSFAIMWMVVGLIPIIITGIAGLYFVFKDPSFLRSEDYHLREKAIQMIMKKGDPFPVYPASIENIANPASQRSLPPKEPALLGEDEAL